MTSLLYILKGLLIGVIASVPIGPIMMLTVQKSVNDGHKAGLSCGLGATIVDTTCALISAFALSYIGTFIDQHTALIQIIGGIVVGGVGVSMILTKIEKNRRKKRQYSPRNFVKAATMGYLNPAALAVMLTLFAFFHMEMDEQSIIIPILSVIAVGAGSALFWYIFSGIIAHFGERFNIRILLWISRIAGTGVVIFGVILLIKGIMYYCV